MNTFQKRFIKQKLGSRLHSFFFVILTLHLWPNIVVKVCYENIKNERSDRVQTTKYCEMSTNREIISYSTHNYSCSLTRQSITVNHEYMFYKMLFCKIIETRRKRKCVFVVNDVMTAPVSNGWTTTTVGEWQTFWNFPGDKGKLRIGIVFVF